MAENIDPMAPFEFMIGEWDMAYNIPESSFSPACTGTGQGTFRRALKETYVMFDYRSKMEGQEGGAHGIFAWDEAAKVHRYWWFEDSGTVMTASCVFTDADTLHMNWCEKPLIQTFQRTGANTMTLHMSFPAGKNEFELILEVLFTRKK